MLECCFIPDDYYLSLINKIDDLDLPYCQKKMLKVIVGYYHQAHFLENPPTGYHANGLLIINIHDFRDLCGFKYSSTLKDLEKLDYLTYLMDVCSMSIRLQLNWEKF